MLLIRFLLVLFSFGTLINTAFGQDCREWLVGYVDEMKRVDNVGRCYMDFEIYSNFWDTKMPKQEFAAKVSVVGLNYYLDSKFYSIYSDGKEVFLVNNIKKTIIRSNSVGEAKELSIKKIVNKEQQDIALKGSVILCVDTIISQTSYRMIRVEPPKQIAKVHNIWYITYLFRLSDKRISRITVNYNMESKMMVYTLKINDFVVDYHEKRPRNVASIFLNGKNGLRSSYKKFLYYDNRN